MASTHDITAPIARPAAVRHSPRLSAYVTSDIATVRALWNRLEANPAMAFHQSLAWVEAWTAGTGAPIQLVTLEREGSAFALLPLEIHVVGGLKVARFAGTAFSNENTGLIDIDRLDAVGPVGADELAAALLSAGLKADIALFDKMTPQVAGRAPFAGLNRVRHQNPSFQLPLFEDFNAVLAQINAKRRRKKFRVSVRRLEAMGGYRHIIGEDDDQALRLLNAFLTQKTARLAAQGLPNVFGSPGIAAFLAHLATRRDCRGRPALELHGIELASGMHKGHIIAVAGLTLKQGHVTCQFGSIDEEIGGEASAGELLFYRMIEDAAKAGHTVFDFGVGDQLYKRSWCPVRTDLVDCHVGLTRKGRIAAPLIAGITGLKRTVKSSPTLHRAAAWLRGLMVTSA